MQQLVGVGVADARDRALVPEHALDLGAAGLLQDPLEYVDRERLVERVRPEARDAGDVVREVSFADSSLQYCATCQTGGKPLADRRLSKLLR